MSFCKHQTITPTTAATNMTKHNQKVQQMHARRFCFLFWRASQESLDWRVSKEAWNYMSGGQSLTYA